MFDHERRLVELTAMRRARLIRRIGFQQQRVFGRRGDNRAQFLRALEADCGADSEPELEFDLDADLDDASAGLAQEDELELNLLDEDEEAPSSADTDKFQLLLLVACSALIHH